MEFLWLIISVAVAWTVSITVDLLLNLGQLLVPSNWVLLALGLGLAAWLIHPD